MKKIAWMDIETDREQEDMKNQYQKLRTELED